LASALAGVSLRKLDVEDTPAAKDTGEVVKQSKPNAGAAAMNIAMLAMTQRSMLKSASTRNISDKPTNNAGEGGPKPQSSPEPKPAAAKAVSQTPGGPKPKNARNAPEPRPKPVK